MDGEPETTQVVVGGLGGAQVSPEVLEEVVHRVVEAADPERIVLFGSAARGTAKPESDIDLLVVKGGADSWEVAREIYRHLVGVGAAVDVVVVSPEVLERYRESPGLVFRQALNKGRVVYEADRAPSTR